MCPCIQIRTQIYIHICRPSEDQFCVPYRYIRIRYLPIFSWDVSLELEQSPFLWFYGLSRFQLIDFISQFYFIISDKACHKITHTYNIFQRKSNYVIAVQMTLFRTVDEISRKTRCFNVTFSKPRWRSHRRRELRDHVPEIKPIRSPKLILNPYLVNLVCP